MVKDVKAFLKTKRKVLTYRPVRERIKDYKEVGELPTEKHSREQASRCMDCGTPFCHWICPLGNYIPEWNDLMLCGQWKKAFEFLDAVNTMPEITGRVCPALCEYACVLGINDEPVTIRENELGVIEYAFKKGWVKSKVPKVRSGKKVAVIGSGPAGLACAAQLNRAGHNVLVFEKDDKAGGILRYGIPDFKLEKWVVDRRLEIYKQEGIEFKTGVNVGVDYPASKLKEEFDAVCLAGGSRVPRDLNIEGRDLKGIYFAMDYLVQSNRRVVKEIIPPDELIDAKNRKVVVIGGGDTGADCVGTALRQGALSVVQIELLAKPSESRPDDCPWPYYPALLKTLSSHQEGGQRLWSVLTKKFVGAEGRVNRICCVKVEFTQNGKEKPVMNEIAGNGFEIEAGLIIIAMGFLHPERNGLVDSLNIELDSRGNVRTDENRMTSLAAMFSAGDMCRGQSLVVWAVYEGLCCARAINEYLKKIGYQRR